MRLRRGRSARHRSRREPPADRSTPDPDFRLRDIAVTAYGPSVLFGLAEGAMLPVITLSAIDRGANAAVAAFVAALLGIGSIISNIPSGVLATRVGERMSMVIAAALSALGLVLCIVPGDLWVYGAGVLLIGCASSVFSLARQSYLTERVPVRMWARALSTLGGSMRVGVFVGPFAGAAVMHVFGVTSAYVVALIAVVGAGAIAYTVPDLDERAGGAGAAAKVTTVGMLRRYWTLFLTLGLAILLLSAIRQTRQIVIPLWADHIGLTPASASVIYGIAGAIDAATFYPAGKVMDRWGRRAVAVPCMLLMGVSFLLMPLTHGFGTLVLVALLMGFSNGIGSGIVMTLGADVSPSVGRPTFLGLWRELADAGSGIGPVILSAVTGFATLGAGIVVSGLIGFAAAAALYRWIPRPRARLPSTEVGAVPTSEPP
ncbi:MAG: MFS transporter [Gordonia sp. (in: high G+C Gram-positive bacteria)]